MYEKTLCISVLITRQKDENRMIRRLPEWNEIVESGYLARFPGKFHAGKDEKSSFLDQTQEQMYCHLVN